MSALVLRLVAGASDRDEVVLPLGVAVPLLSVGTSGAWRVGAVGVGRVHAVLAFNGETLFLGASGAHSVWLDGGILGKRWVEVREGSEIDLGRARIVVERRGAEAKPGKAELASTKAMSPDLILDALAKARLRDAEPSVPGCVAPIEAPTRPSDRSASGLAAAWKAWRASSPARRAALALVPLVPAVLAIGLAGAAHAHPTKAALPVAVTAEPAPIVVARPTPASPVADASPSAAPTPSAAPAPPSPDAADALDASGRTPERVALDAVVAGSFLEAAARYDALAARHPENIAFREAARILRERR